MLAPLAPYCIIVFLSLAGAPESPVMVEPMHTVGFDRFTEENPLLGLVWWEGKSPTPTGWVKASSTTGGGYHPLPLPKDVSKLPVWFKVAAYSKHGYSDTRWCAVGLSVTGGYGP